MATLGATGGLATWGLSGGKKKEQGPPTNSESKEEEDFIQYVNRHKDVSAGNVRVE